MNNRCKRKMISIALTAGIIFTSACGNNADKDDYMHTADGGQLNTEIVNDDEYAPINPEDMFTERDISGEYDDNVFELVLADGACNFDDVSQVTADGDVISITSQGTYILSGFLSDGMIVVDAGDSDKVQLVLNGLDITSRTSAPIYVKNAKKVFVTLAAGTDNTLTNGGSYEQIDDNNIDAVVFAKDDITFNGEGSLTINASAGHGVVGKDDIAITSGTYTISSDSHSFDGKNSVRVAGGTFTLNTGKDGLHAENDDDATLGFVYVNGGDFSIAAGSDGISAATELRIDGGNINIKESEEGLEGKDILINNGDIKIVSSDDGINASDASSSGDKGMSGDGGRPEFRDGEMPEPGDGEVPESGDGGRPEFRDGEMPEPGDGGHPEFRDDEMPEGMEKPERGERPDGTMPPDMKNRGGRPDMPEGEDFDKDFDGTDRKRMGGGPRGGGFDVQDTSIVINDGTITIDAEGDGIDSNGTLTVNGGTVYIAGPTRGGNGALDYGKEAVITGGTVIAVGDSSMAETFSETSTQAYALVGVEEQSEGGSIILKDKSGNELISWSTTKRYNSVVISSPDMKSGETYILVTGEDSTELCAK